jgi:glycosyltransferase involved in cell wall biosynthesis
MMPQRTAQLSRRKISDPIGSALVKPKRHRLAVLNSHPIQYFAPLYRRLAQQPEIDLTVYYCSRQGAEGYYDSGFRRTVRWDVPLLEGYNYKFLPNMRGNDHVDGFASLINPGIVREIRKERYDALWIHGYAYLTDFLALAAARLSATPVFYHSESSRVYDSRVRRPLHVRAIKPGFLRLLFRQCSAFLAIGTLNREFYLSYGVGPERIYKVPYSVDNQYFASKVDSFLSERQTLRSAMGISPDAVVFLFAAKMSPNKSPLELLQAYGRLRDLPNKALVMVGEGELRAQTEAYAARNNLNDVQHVGFVNQSDLPRYYAISDVFVRPDGLAKGDWGLSVNEAMASGLAIIATDSIGATRDLVKDGENGVVVSFGDLEELAAAMRRLVADPSGCRRMGERSREIIAGWGYDQCVAGVLEALGSVSK